MPLSRLENFLKNTDGNIIYVNPSDLDATDSIENQGNSLTRPFKTIQRALLEAARFSYNIGRNNDRFDKTTILVYPGVHYIDNRPGYVVANAGDTFLKLDPNISATSTPVYTSADLPQLSLTSNFDIFDPDNDLHKYNSTEGGVILPRGTSVTGLDLRKTKIRPLFVPDPENSVISNTSIFRITGGCYFYQFTIFDGDQNGVVYKNYRTDKYTPTFSHHKLTAFEYVDGANQLNKVSIGSTTSVLTDLEMYYIKVQKAYGDSSGRGIGDYPGTTDLEVSNPEFRIVGAVSSDDIGISSVTSVGSLATIDTATSHGLAVDDSIRITGISSELYNGSFSVSGITSNRTFSYFLPTTPADPSPELTGTPKVVIEPDTVSGASPYIFNVSLRSQYGMSGLHADGSKVTGFKSVVVAQFTGIGLQKDDNAFVLYDQTSGTYKTETEITDVTKKPLHLNSNAIYKPGYENFHVKASNDAFIQDVSVFAIGYANHFVSESGGDQSVTNSNSNFGSKSLIAVGFKKDAFSRDDVGYITHIIPPKETNPQETAINFPSLNVGLTTNPVGGITTSRLYLFGYSDIDTPPENNIDSYRFGAKDGDILNVVINDITYKTPVLMTIPSAGDGPSARKLFKVQRNNGSNNISSNIITLSGNHNFINGESVRVLSDNGHLPDGLEFDSLYYVITNTAVGSLAANQIKLAKTFNDATVGTPVEVTIFNNTGGILTIESRVTDKEPGELGHPIQFDSTNNNWYVVGSGSTALNTITQGLIDNRGLLSEQTGKTFFLRKPDERTTDDRIYRIRYVIPKEFTSAKEPTPSFIIQESSTVGVSSVGEFTSVGDVTKQRNVKVIANASYNANVITVTTEKPHRLNVGDNVIINNVRSADNPTGIAGSAFNDTYDIVSVPNSKTFTVTTAKSPGSFIDNISTRDQNLPTVARKKYRNTYFVYDIERIQQHVPSQRDGIYHLICLDASVSPTTSDGTFDSERFSQNVGNLYPTIDRDNYNSDPEFARSWVETDTIGNVIVNDRRDSITKETTLNFYKDNRIGYAVTFGTSNPTGLTTIFTNVEHNLNSIRTLTISNAGGGYAGVATVLFNVPLVGTGITGDGATANVTVNASGQITALTIVDGGSAYGVGNTMRVGVGSTGIVQVASINNNIGDVVEVVGVGSTASRYESQYNGVFRITGINSTRSVTYSITNVSNTAVDAGIYTAVSGHNGLFFVSDKAIGVSTIGYGNSTVGIVTVTTSTGHGLAAGNKFKLVGAAQTVYNGTYTVRERVGLTTFNFYIGAGTSNPDFTTNSGVFVLKQSIGSQDSDSNVNSEKIANRLSPFYAGITTTLSNALTGTATTAKFNSLVGLSTGDYYQIDGEIIRLAGSFNGSTNVADVIRGALGTKAETHDASSVARKINIIPTELRRFSAIRASGHTFEYLGYGHGNYSAALPSRQNRILTKNDQLLSQAKQSDGGTVVYTGLNDSGDFYLGNKRISSVNGQEETINAPIQTFLGDEISSLALNFDDVTIKNTLKVEGGPSRLLASEFKGPVNFSNKVTSTSPDGAEFVKILLKDSLTKSREYSVADRTPTAAPNNQGDIFFNALPGVGTQGYAGWINVGNSASDWRRFGLISRSATETFITPDRIGVNSTGPSLRILPNAPGSPEALVDVRGGLVADYLRVIGNVDFVNGATFAAVDFGNLYVTGITSFVGTTDSTDIRTGIVTIAGGVGIAKNLNVGAGLSISGIATFAQNVFINGTDDSHSKDTGCLVLEGGLGVEKNVNIGANLNVTGISTIRGNTFIGDSTADVVTINAEIDSNLIPEADSTYDIGSAQKWRNANFSGIVTATTFDGTATAVGVGSTNSSTEHFITLVDSNNLTQTSERLRTDPNLSFNPSTNILSILDGSGSATGMVRAGVGSFTSTNGGGITVSAVNTGAIGGFRNLLQNGEHLVFQRDYDATSGLASKGWVGNANGAFITDRWFMSHATNGVPTVSRNSTSGDLLDHGFRNCLRVEVTTADANITDSQFAWIAQRIESNITPVLRFGEGAANAQPVTVSFWVRVAQGPVGAANTYSVSLFNGYSLTPGVGQVNCRGISKGYTIDALNTWEYKTITFPGCPDGTWNKGGQTVGLEVRFGLAAGLNAAVIPDIWDTTQPSGVVGQTNFMGTQGNVFEITGCQLEMGTVATPYERVDFGTELKRCERYYEIGNHFGSQYATTTSTNEKYVQFKTLKMNAGNTLLFESGTLLDGGQSGVVAGTHQFIGIYVDGFTTQFAGYANSVDTAPYIYDWHVTNEIPAS